ncbi:sugar ABC transporter substrate-binding protein [Nocardioides sp. JQ2195]|uniref:sugar ABC transporter substrate-binding protein n=1 Tax=Nocardioides sp. JQ2195 TaxID=2592334 RepID=UPI00143E9A1E|nr:sugar ABC transporter substrate-binding protein [Nocardioides sp. JQ2195]QIX26951.1 sugar ABC transporter substrate-binding protein [Nocardioides sp. JQ2195]
MSNAKPVKLAWFTPTTQNDYWKVNGVGIEAAAKARNATVTTFDAGFDEQKQYAQIQDAIATGKFDAFLVTPVDASGVVPAIAEAAEAGIKVVCGNYPCGSNWETPVSDAEGVVAQTGIPEASLGKSTGQLIVEACEGKDPCEVAQLPGAMIPAEEALFDGVKQVLSSHPEIEIVARVEAGYLAAPAQAATQDILQSNPDLDVVAASSDAMAAGIELAVKAAGVEDQVKIIGLAGGQRGLAKVRSGTWFGTVMMYPFDEGMYLVDQAVRAVRSQRFRAGINPAEELAWPMVFTKENSAEFGDYSGQWAG